MGARWLAEEGSLFAVMTIAFLSVVPVVIGALHHAAARGAAKARG